MSMLELEHVLSEDVSIGKPIALLEREVPAYPVTQGRYNVSFAIVITSTQVVQGSFSSSTSAPSSVAFM